MSGSTAFFAPLIGYVPTSGRPPRMTRVSPVSGRHQGAAARREAFMKATITEAALTAPSCAAYKMIMTMNLLQKGWYFTLLK